MTQRDDLLNNKNAFNWLKEIKEINHFIIEMTIDVLIIGAGHGGIAAARSAIEENSSLDILVAEQQSKDQFRVLGSGEIGHINSKWLAKHKMPKVDIGEFVDDWQLRTNNRSNYGLIRKYANNCGDCFDWMIEVLDEEEVKTIYPMLKNSRQHMPKTLNGIHSYPGTAKMPVNIQNVLMKKNRDLASQKGVTFLYDTKGYKLLTKKDDTNNSDSRNGNEIIGAILESEQGYIKVLTRRGVILAAGDYSKNPQMCRDLLTESADMIDQDKNWLGQGWKGDGLRLGMLAGGRMEPRPHSSVGGNYSFPGMEAIGSTAVLRINKYGERYSNEGFGTHVLAAVHGAKQPNGMLYGIFDSGILEQIRYQAHCYGVFDYSNNERVEKLEKDLKRALEAGRKGVPISVVPGNENPSMPRILYGADTTLELATYLFEDPDSRRRFLQTIERYNEICGFEEDVDFGKEKSLLHDIRKPPFFAVGQLKNSHRPIGQSFKLIVTTGGLLINDNQQVLDDEYEPIKGLFATGNTSGCRFGFQYSTSISGQSISMAHTLGRELGRFISHIAEEQ